MFQNIDAAQKVFERLKRVEANKVAYNRIANPNKDKDADDLREAINYLQQLRLVVVDKHGAKGAYIFKQDIFYEAFIYDTLQEWIEKREDEAGQEDIFRRLELKLIKSNIELNGKTKKNILYTKIMAAITLLVIGVQVFFSVQASIRNNDYEDISKKLQEVQLQSSKIEEEYQELSHLYYLHLLHNKDSVLHIPDTTSYTKE